MHNGERGTSQPRRPGTSPSGAPSDPSAPFAPGSVSIRLYPHNELAAGAIVSELCEQAGLALHNGFDGVMTSEHHGQLRGLHGPAAADGVLRPGHARDGLGRRGATPAPTPVHCTRRRGGGVAAGSLRRSGRASSAAAGTFCRRTSRRRASARPTPSNASRPSCSSPRRSASGVRTWAGSRVIPPCSPAGAHRSLCSVQPSRLPPPPGGLVWRGDPDGRNVGAGEARPPDPGLRGAGGRARRS